MVLPCLVIIRLTRHVLINTRTLMEIQLMHCSVFTLRSKNFRNSLRIKYEKVAWN